MPFSQPTYITSGISRAPLFVEDWSPHPKTPTQVGLSLPRRLLIGQPMPMKLFGTGLQDMRFARLLHILRGFLPDSFMDHRVTV